MVRRSLVCFRWLCSFEIYIFILYSFKINDFEMQSVLFFLFLGQQLIYNVCKCNGEYFFKLFVVSLPETLKYWVGVQRGQRRCLFSLGWPPI